MKPAMLPVAGDIERRYRLLADALPQMIWTADGSGKVVHCNAAWLRYTGVSASRVCDRTWRSALHPDDLELGLAAWTTSLASGRPHTLEIRLRHVVDGTYHRHLARVMPMRDMGGRAIAWIGTFDRIGDDGVTGETRTILDTIGHIIAMRSEAGAVIFMSPQWSEQTGTVEGSALGTGWREHIHPDDLALVDRRHLDACATDSREHSLALRIRTASGDYRWFHARTVSLSRADGSPRRWLDTLTDIDELKRTQAALEQSQTRYRALTDALPHLLWITDARGALDYVNEWWVNYTGLSFERSLERGAAAIVHPDDLVAFAAKHAAMRDNLQFECELRLLRADGAYRWHLIRIVSLDDPDVAALKWIVTATDIEERKAAARIVADAAAKIDYLAHHDPITKLPNRVLLMDRLSQAIAQAERGGTGVIVLFLDLDRFKVINDIQGRAAGDRILAVTGNRITPLLRSGDTASRIGADEFVVICVTSDGAQDAGGIAARLLEAVAEPVEIGGAAVKVNASIGISLYPTDDSDGDELIRKAEIAMRSAKEHGRSAFRLYSAEQHVSVLATIAFEAELRAALERSEFVLYYQPICALTSGRVVGAEALVRWAHPQRGVLLPGDFIAFAEERGLIDAIGDVVLHAACAQIKRLQLTDEREFRLAINVSAHQLQRHGFVDSVAAALRTHAVDARRLEIEITESVLMGNTRETIDVLREIEALGVQLSIDDFGTGYSSLAYIKNFPIHTLKIDRSFVTDIAVDRTDQAIAMTIITLAHSLGMRVIAEGVEDEAQAERLREFDSDNMQGYLISRPIPAAEFERFLRAADARDA